MLIKVSLGIVVLALSLSLHAAEVPVSNITYVAPWSPHVDVKMNSTGLDPHGCGQSDLYRIDLVNDPGAEAKYSAILAAFISGKQVGLSISGCVGNRPKIQGVRMSQ
jgi:hypothetical protein